MREHEWINTTEARQRRGERSLFAIDDVLRALRNGKPIPENAERVLGEVSRETARAGAWRMIDRLRREDPPADPARPAEMPEPSTEPRAYDWDDDPREAARLDDRYWDDLYDRDED